MAVRAAEDDLPDDSRGILTPSYRVKDGARPAFLRTVQTRTDTSYIFCTEVQVLPASKPTADGNPRMSVIMPTPSYKSPVNDTETGERVNVCTSVPPC